jgi:hypothetical protein
VSDRRCCEPGPPMRTRRAFDVAGTVVPVAVLALLPKCPACIVAWLAVGAGIGISMPAAAWLRGLILVSCLACLAFVAARHLRRSGVGSSA